MSARPIFAALGDSLTVGEHADGNPIHNHPWPAYLDAKLFPSGGIGQFGLGGDIVSGMQSRYRQFIKGFGFYGLILWGGINDIIADTPAATIWATMESLIDEALADGLVVVMVFTPGFGLYAGWSAPRQANLNALRLLMKAKTGVTQVDLYQPFPVGLNDPLNPLNFYPQFAFSDGLHIDPDGQSYNGNVIMPPVIAALLPQPPSVSPAPPVGLTAEQIFIGQGDTSPALARQLVDEDGNVLDLTIGSPTVVFNMVPVRGGSPIINAHACTIYDAPNGIVELAWPTGSTNTVGDFYGNFVVTQNGLRASYPNANTVTVRITKALV